MTFFLIRQNLDQKSCVKKNYFLKWCRLIPPQCHLKQNFLKEKHREKYLNKYLTAKKMYKKSPYSILAF